MEFRHPRFPTLHETIDCAHSDLIDTKSDALALVLHLNPYEWRCHFILFKELDEMRKQFQVAKVG